MTARAAEYGLVFEEPPPPLRVVEAQHDQVRPTTAKRKAPSTYVAPDSHREHGSYVKYVVEKCRCVTCRAANRDYERKRQRAMSRPDQVWCPYVPAGRARRHIHELMAQGVGPKSIAVMSGVPHGAVSKLIYGDYKGRGPSKRIRPETEAKILAVTMSIVDGAQKIDAKPTWRLLDDLIARGFTKSWLAKQLGSKAKTTHPGLQVKRDLVRASTARKVELLHRRLQGVDAPQRRTRWSR